MQNNNQIEEVAHVSVADLVAHPEQYDQKKVRVVGVAKIGFETTALYESAEDRANANTNQAVWLEIPVPEKTKLLEDALEVREKTKQWDGTLVVAEGVFVSDRKGHLGMYSGILINVTLSDAKQ